MHADVWSELQSGAWAQLNPRYCPCGGRGWFCSDFDTLHQCPVHGGTPHPDDDDGLAAFDFDQHRLQVLRRVYRTFQRRSGLTQHEFLRLCRQSVVSYNGAQPTPQQWIDIAETISDEFSEQQADAAAQRAGFSCALEQRWAQDAEDERRERSGGY